MKYKRSDLIGEVGQEIAMRRRVYPQLISTKRMHQDQAEKQIERMEILSKILQALTEAEYDVLIKRTEQPEKPVLQMKLFQ